MIRNKYRDIWREVKNERRALAGRPAFAVCRRTEYNAGIQSKTVPWSTSMEKKAKLVEVKAATSIYIDVEMTQEGNLLFSGQDIGEAPESFFGDSDYEYWLMVEEEQKDRVLLALIEKHYSGNTSVITEFQALLKSKDIPSEFHSWA